MDDFGLRLDRNDEGLRRAWAQWTAIPVDAEMSSEPGHEAATGPQTTLARAVEVSGPGTFSSGALRRLRLEPWDEEGWWMDRTDLDEGLPTRVSVRNVWTTGAIVRNIVLRSGPPHNYVRMVEHIIALKLGLGLDRLMIRLESGDPPLFERGSFDLVEAVESAGLKPTTSPVRWFTVKERVSLCSPTGAFLILSPASGRKQLLLDVAVDFPNVIGQQRIRCIMSPELFRRVCVARTNTSVGKLFYCRTIGRLFADIRNLGYTDRNILVAGRRRYRNAPRLVHNGKSPVSYTHLTLPTIYSV